MKKLIALGLILLLLIMTACSNVMSNNIDQMPKVNIKNEAQTSKDSLESKFVYLSNAHTNYCAKADIVFSKSDDEKLQGSCCSKMDFHRYSEQVEGLKKYSNIDKIPKDPYDIPVSVAKELLSYKSIKLSAEQQMVYDDAMKMSHEHGPCCCKCWRWDAFEGLAKYLITYHNFNAQQIAEVWDLEDGCGGKGHEHHAA